MYDTIKAIELVIREKKKKKFEEVENREICVGIRNTGTHFFPGSSRCLRRSSLLSA